MLDPLELHETNNLTNDMADCVIQQEPIGGLSLLDLWMSNLSDHQNDDTDNSDNSNMETSTSNITPGTKSLGMESYFTYSQDNRQNF